MKAYKGFKNDMTCRNFQYEEGKEYHEERALCCDTGFHACEYPLDCFRYYAPADSVYHEVEQTGDIDKSEGDSKVASTEIKIGAKIGIPGLVQAALGLNAKAKGVKGAYIICAEFEADNDANYRIKGIQLHQVDGEKIKEETYYQLIDGVMTEVD